MQESLLHHLWSLQYFDKRELLSTEGERVEIFEAGILNRDAGPDFSEARVRIGNLNWVGSVEIHTLSSAWTEHHHEDDPAYDRVILHVVWQDDRPVCRRDGTRLPTITLRNRVEETLLRQYRQLIGSAFSIPCKRQYPAVESLKKTSMIARALAARLERKAKEVLQLFASVDNSWEDTAYHLVAGAFGFKINREPFLQLARSLPMRILQKHADSGQVEALIFGQAGFLEGKRGDTYYQRLRKEYQLLSHKYQLDPLRMSRAQWLFLRLRPSNFPTVRLAQFAALLHARRTLFSGLVDTVSTQELSQYFDISVSPYWAKHYRFSVPGTGRAHELGSESVRVILVNTVVPLLAAYAQHTDDHVYFDRALQILESLAPEENGITRRWTDLGSPAQNAGEAQGQIELFNTFCQKKRCLQCMIGAAIVRPHNDEVATAPP